MANAAIQKIALRLAVAVADDDLDIDMANSPGPELHCRE
jgi:hypothetical protein